MSPLSASPNYPRTELTFKDGEEEMDREYPTLAAIEKEQAARGFSVHGQIGKAQFPPTVKTVQRNMDSLVENLIREGYAIADASRTFRFRENFLLAELDAKREKKGAWA